MSSVDERIVQMRFDASQFEGGIARAITALSQLDKALKLDGATKGFADLNTAAQKLNVPTAPIVKGIVDIGSAIKSISFSSLGGLSSGLANVEGALRKVNSTGVNEATKSVKDLGAAANNVSLAPLAAEADQVSARFSAMSVAGVAALGTIVSKATIAGGQIAKALSIQPALEGFSDYELKIGATQTIMAGTGENIGTVTKYLKELDIYADETIYSLSDMTTNIGKFTNAGVKLPVAVQAMKGISNVAALSGASSNEAARAMYNLGQAIGQGTVKLMDWKSVELANMGTKEFKEQLIQSGVAAGTLTKGLDGTLKTTKGNIVNFKTFNSTLADGWLTSEALTSTLTRYADKQSDIGKRAYSAAQDVKTFSMMMETLKASAGTGWTDTFDIVIGNLPEATKLFTGISNEFGKMLNDSANARNTLLKSWKDLGGRDALFSGIKNAFHAVVQVFSTVKSAFREIFPAATGQQLADMSKSFLAFTEKLKMGGETAQQLKSTFAGVFAIFGIGWEILKQVVGVFTGLFGAMSKGDSGILKTTASIGDFLVKLHTTVKSGQGLKDFFASLTGVLIKPIELIKRVTNAIANMFPKKTIMQQKMALLGVKRGFEPLEKLGANLKSVWERVIGVLDNVANAFGPIADAFSKFFDKIAKMGTGAGSFDITALLSVANIAAISAIAVMIKGLVDTFGEVIKSMRGVADEAKGLMTTLKAPFEELTNTLSAMQNTLRAMTLIQIAGAIALLAYSLVTMSKIDPDGLKQALVAMAILFTQLSIAMAIFQKIEIKSSAFQMVLLASAIVILSKAVQMLGGMDLLDLAKGLAGVYILLLGLAGAMRLMPEGKNTIRSAAAIVIMAYAIKVLAQSVKSLAEMDWQEMAKGLVGVGALLGALALYSKFAQANKGGVLAGAGIVLLAVGIKILASAMTDIAKLSWEEIGKGLTGVGVGLGLMAGALALLPPSSILSAAALFIVAGSISVIALALKGMASMSWEDISKGLVLMGGALAIIAIAMNSMLTALPGAAALAVVAASLNVLLPILMLLGQMGWESVAKGLVMLGGALTIIALAMSAMLTALPGALALIVVAGALNILLPILMLAGQMSWESIGKGLLMLAGAFTVIGIAGALLTPVIPTLIGLGVAIGLLGVGIALAGVGMLAFATGLTALSAAGAAGAVAIVAILSAIAGTIPMLFRQVAAGLIEFANVIARGGPAFSRAMVTVILSLMDAINKTAPKVVSTMMRMLDLLLRALVHAIPRLVDAGMKMVIGILDGIGRNIGKMITKAADLIVAFLNGISKNLSRVINAGVDLVIAFVNGVAKAIDSRSGEIGAAGGRLGVAMATGMAKGVFGAVGAVVKAVTGMISSAIGAAKRALDSHSPSREFAKLGAFAGQGFVVGLDGTKAQVVAAVNQLQVLIKAAQAKAAADVKSLQAKLNKLNKAKRKDQKAIKATKAALAEAKAELAKADAAWKVSRSHADEIAMLGKLETKANAVAAKLVTANEKLVEATKVRDEYNKSISEKYDDLPDFSKETKLSDYVADMEKQIVNTQIFKAQLEELRKRGLNDEMFKDLLEKGVDAMPFVQQILEGGQASVDQLNTLGGALDKSADALGVSASKALYQAGVDAAAGLVKGLQNEAAAIEKQMDIIGLAMVNAIKKALGIKSPSREFMKVGDWSVKGLAKGFEKSGDATKAAEGIGHNAIDAMRKTLTGLKDIVEGDVDMHPTIRPVLDLSDVRKNAAGLGTMLTTRPLSVGVAYSRAVDVSEGYKSNQSALADALSDRGDGRGGDTYNQYLYSPKALSSAEVYRQTKNLISKRKES